MKNRFRFAFDHTVIGTVLTGFAGQAALVVSGVLVARALGPNDRGELALIVAIAVALSYIVAMGLPTAIAFTAARDPEKVAGAVWAVRHWAFAQVVFVFFVTIATLAIVLPEDDAARTVALVAVPPAAVSLIATMYGLAVLQGLSRFGAFNILRLVPALGNALGAVVVVVIFDSTIAQFAIAWSLTYMVAALMIVFVVARALRGRERKPADAREMVSYGLKAQVGTVSPLENFQIDQIVVGAIAGPIALGFYVIGAAFTNLPRFISQSLGMVVFPRVAGRLGKGGARNVAQQAMIATLMLVGGIVVVLEFAMGAIVPFFFGEAFVASVPVARIMLIAAFFLSMRRVLGDVLRGANKPLPGSIAAVIGWFVYGATVVPLTLKWDASGGAVALALAAAVSVGYIGLAALRVSRHQLAGEVATDPGALPVP